MNSKQKPIFTPTLKLFMGAMILANISSMMSFGYISLYLADLGAGVSDIGTVFTITSLVPLVLQIVGGWLSDSIGRLKTIAIGSVAGVIGAIGLRLAPSWENRAAEPNEFGRAFAMPVGQNSTHSFVSENSRYLAFLHS